MGDTRFLGWGQRRRAGAAKSHVEQAAPAPRKSYMNADYVASRQAAPHPSHLEHGALGSCNCKTCVS